MCACDEGQECARHSAERERHEDEEQREFPSFEALLSLNADEWAYFKERWRQEVGL